MVWRKLNNLTTLKRSQKGTNALSIKKNILVELLANSSCPIGHLFKLGIQLLNCKLMMGDNFIQFLNFY
jgi:hypothetical protein